MTDEQFEELFNKAKELMNKTKDPVHDWRHIERVLVNANRIIKRLPEKVVESLDMKILKLAAAWHDISFVFHKAGFRQFLLEHRRAVRIARNYFKQVDLADSEANLICSVIYAHTFNVFGGLNKKKSLYYQIVQDADNLDSYSPVFSKERINQAEEAARRSSLYYKLIIRVLKPLFFNFLVRHKHLVYNLPEIVKKLNKENDKH